MQTVGVICEYNPFHLGHARQLGLIRQQLGPEAAIVCLMSGNYVQRGEPAVFDKCVRARAAVEAGASLVLELPGHIRAALGGGLRRGRRQHSVPSWLRLSQLRLRIRRRGRDFPRSGSLPLVRIRADAARKHTDRPQLRRRTAAGAGGAWAGWAAADKAE